MYLPGRLARAESFSAPGLRGATPLEFCVPPTVWISAVPFLQSLEPGKHHAQSTDCLEPQARGGGVLLRCVEQELTESLKPPPQLWEGEEASDVSLPWGNPGLWREPMYTFCFQS